MSELSAALPEPDRAAALLSESLAQRIRAEIHAACGQRIGFSRYMDLVLHAPGLGYYSGGSVKFGRCGDFTTAPEISSVFGACLARQAAQVLASVDGGQILEVGAGSGALAVDILRELEKIGRLPAQYNILDVSADLRQRQSALLQSRIPHLYDRVCWLSAWPEPPWDGLILANELLDAMPVHRLKWVDGGWQELCVGDQDGVFFEDCRPISDVRLQLAADALTQHSPGLPNGYVTELGLAASDWVRGLSHFLAHGLAIIIDYGYPRQEYYLPERGAGTLRCYYRHRAHDDPYTRVGLQDMTAHVDFTALAEVASDVGLDVLGFTTQASFLMGCGLLQGLPELEGVAQIQRAQQLRTLLLPGGMGEAFKVMALARGLEAPLLGFSLRDERFRL